MQPSRMIRKYWHAITRKKTINFDEQPTALSRVLSLLDLVAFGVGSTLGLGVYVLAGSVAKNYAGPATSLSFLVAAIVALFGGLCFAEFAARVPRTGYSYAYCYAGVGELVGFLVGWNLLLGSLVGTASVSTGMSSYLDTLVDNKITKALDDVLPIHVSYFTSSPDLVGLAIIVLLTILLAVGMQESSMFNKICTFFNMLTIFTVIIACAFKVDITNWKISQSDIDQGNRSTAGNGGYAPYGISGVIAGVPNCFFGLLGFDAAAVCSEEAKNPKRDIPLAILLSLFIIFIVYFSLSTVLTLAWPYYLQNEDAPFSYVFGQFGWIELKWIVTIGAIFALSSTALGSIYFAPRVLYAIANDGLIFKFLAKVHPVTKTPVISTILSGTLAGIITTFLKLDALLDLMTIGSFFSYTVVALSVIVLRYDNQPSNTLVPTTESFQLQDIKSFFECILNVNKKTAATKTTSIVANISAIFFTISSAIFCVIIRNTSAFPNNTSLYTSCSGAIVIMIIPIIMIVRQPESDKKISFKVPLVPFIPCLSILFNLYLMMELDLFTWAGFVGWIFLGSLIYFFYGIEHSEENNRSENT